MLERLSRTRPQLIARDDLGLPRLAKLLSQQQKLLDRPLLDADLNLYEVRARQIHDQGQDVSEYAVMLAVILLIVRGTFRLIGLNFNKAFSSVAR
jgi:hypothetical protein